MLHSLIAITSVPNQEQLLVALVAGRVGAIVKVAVVFVVEEAAA